MAKSSITTIGCFNVFFLLFVLPLGFSFGIHYIVSKTYLLKTRSEVQLAGSADLAYQILGDLSHVKKSLIFYDENIQYNKISETNHAFHYQLPLLGKKEIKLIKSKEETLRPTKDKKVLVVGDGSSAGDLQHRR